VHQYGRNNAHETQCRCVFSTAKSVAPFQSHKIEDSGTILATCADLYEVFENLLFSAWSMTSDRGAPSCGNDVHHGIFRMVSLKNHLRRSSTGIDGIDISLIKGNERKIILPFMTSRAKLDMQL
jgi:hypothetical protein